MRGLTKILAGAVVAVGIAGGAQATSIGGSVSNSDFNAAVGALAGWSYLGQTTAAFTLPGSGALTLRSATYGDSFGYSTTSYGSQTVVFGSGAAVGATTSITPGFSPFLFYFANNQPGANAGLIWSDGHGAGGGTWSSQSDMDIFYNAGTNTYAFFYDDGGPPGSQDDNDYNDMVVTYTPATTRVPEPATIALFGAGLIGLGTSVRRRRKA